MIKNLIFNKYRTVVVVVFFAVALTVVGMVLRSRIGELLTSYTEDQTGKQARTCAMLMGEKLDTELEDLEYIASRLETSLDEPGELMPRLVSKSGGRQGLLGINGKAIFGDSLDVSIFDGIQSSFRGEKVITFVEEQGLLFTCPVFHGPNIRYVLYRLYPTASLGERFSERLDDDLGKFCVSTRDGQIVVPFHDSTDEELNWYRSREIQDDFTSMHLEMEVSVAVARSFDTDRGNMLLFEAEIPGTDYLISGFVSKSVASEGIGNLNLLVVWVFGLLMLLVLIGAIYLTRARVKVRESDALREAKAVAEEASRAKSDFLANMSHEIRTPINAVLGMDEMILRESDDESIITYANNIKTAGNTLLGLVNDILDFSKIEANKIEIIPVDYDLAAMINDLVNMIYTRADDKGLEMHLDFDSELPRRLNGDEMRIKQVITNILTNAVKYTKKGSITFHIGYEKNVYEPDSIFLHVSVSDTGIGIREEDMSRLFSEFERIDEEKNRHIEGTGLGMNITKRLIEMMGSTLHVESTYGEGSIFYFSLKQRVVDDEPLGNYEMAYRESVLGRKEYHEKFIAPHAEVLVVDDNPMNLTVFKSLLKRTRVRIDMAESGDECLKLTREKAYDIIFLDHMMPEKDGVETLRELREQEADKNTQTPVVCLTANAISGAKEEYIAEGFDDYLSKPIDADLLEDMMIMYLPTDKIEMTEEGVSEDDGGRRREPLPDFLEEIAEIDTKAGIANHGGDIEAYLDTLRVYGGAYDKYAEEIETYYQKKDMENATIKIHALKSTVKVIGALGLGELAQSLEDAGKAGELASRGEEMEELLTCSRTVGEALAPLVEKKEEVDDSDLPLIDSEKLREDYERIHRQADECNDVGIEDILEEMGAFRLPEEEKERLNRIREALDEFDFVAVKDALR